MGSRDSRDYNTPSRYPRRRTNENNTNNNTNCSTPKKGNSDVEMVDVDEDTQNLRRSTRRSTRIPKSKGDDENTENITENTENTENFTENTENTDHDLSPYPRRSSRLQQKEE